MLLFNAEYNFQIKFVSNFTKMYLMYKVHKLTYTNLKNVKCITYHSTINLTHETIENIVIKNNFIYILIITEYNNGFFF